MYKIFEKIDSFCSKLPFGEDVFFFFFSEATVGKTMALTINLRTSVFPFDAFFFAANQFTKSE